MPLLMIKIAELLLLIGLLVLLGREIKELLEYPSDQDSQSSHKHNW